MAMTFDYTPRLSPKGETIINEKCGCGHMRTEHEARFDLGHGRCTICDCKQFSWVKFIFQRRRKAKGE